MSQPFSPEIDREEALRLLREYIAYHERQARAGVDVVENWRLQRFWDRVLTQEQKKDES